MKCIRFLFDTVEMNIFIFYIKQIIKKSEIKEKRLNYGTLVLIYFYSFCRKLMVKYETDKIKKTGSIKFSSK